MLNISNKYITNLGCSNGMLSGLNTQLLNLNFAYLSKRYRLLGLRALASLMIERGPPTEVIYYHFAAKAPNRRGQEGDGAGGGGGAGLAPIASFSSGASVQLQSERRWLAKDQRLWRQATGRPCTGDGNGRLKAA